MKKTTVLLTIFVLIFFPLGVLAEQSAEKGDIAVSSDAEGKTVVVTIVKDNWTIDCNLDAQGRMAGLYINMKDMKEEGDRVSLSVYFVELKKHSVHYGYHWRYDSHSVTFYKESAMGKKLFVLTDGLIKKLYQTYGLAKLAKEEAVKKQNEYRQILAEEAKLAAERAKKRPDPADIIKQIIKAQ